MFHFISFFLRCHVPPFLIWHFQLYGTPQEISAVPSDTSGVAYTFYVEANLTFCKCQYRGYGERNPHQDKTQSNRKAKTAIPYYWVDLALERLTLLYIEILRGENTGRDRKKVKKLLYYNSESIKNDFENKSMKKMIKLIFLMRQKLDVYLFQVCVGQQDIRR